MTVSSSSNRKKPHRAPIHPPHYAFHIYENNGQPVIVTREGRKINTQTDAVQSFLFHIEQLVAQRGGENSVTPAEIMLIKRAALLEVDLSFQEAAYLSKARGKLDPTIYTHMVDVQRKLLKDLGLKRRSKNITPGRSRLIEGEAREVSYDADD